MTKGAKILVGYGVVLAVLVAATGVAYWPQRNRLRAYVTATTMRELMNVLDTDRPPRVDAASIHTMLERWKRQGWDEDDWGHTLIVSRRLKDGQPVYTVTSLGRSGRRGPCCQQRVTSWEDNAVLEGDTWLQVWQVPR